MQYLRFIELFVFNCAIPSLNCSVCVIVCLSIAFDSINYLVV